MPNGLVFERHLNAGQPNHFNTGQMDAILFSCVLVQYLNGLSSTKDKAYRLTILMMNHFRSELQKFGIQMFLVFKWSGIQIHTVFEWCLYLSLFTGSSLNNP